MFCIHTLRQSTINDTLVLLKRKQVLCKTLGAGHGTVLCTMLSNKKERKQNFLIKNPKLNESPTNNNFTQFNYIKNHHHAHD